MKFDFWHIVLAGVLIIVGAWIVIKLVGALLGFVLWLMTALLIIAVVFGVLYLAYLVLRPGGSRT